jgi:hypothetical protein
MWLIQKTLAVVILRVATLTTLLDSQVLLAASRVQ